MSSVLICENYVLCSNNDADKDMNVSDQLWELQASVVPGSPLSDCPCAMGSRVTAPQSGASVGHVGAGLAGALLQAQDMTLLHSRPYVRF